jgi:hypothetical protein
VSRGKGDIRGGGGMVTKKEMSGRVRIKRAVGAKIKVIGKVITTWITGVPR